MKRILLGLVAVGLASLGATSCASDPTSELSGTPTSISASLNTIFINVGDSVQVTARTLDEQGLTLPAVPEVASSTPSVVTVTTLEPGPLAQTTFSIKAVAFGTGTVTMTQGGATGTITVYTFPAGVALLNVPAAAVNSGGTVQLDVAPLNTTQDTIVADTAYIWSSNDESVLTVDSTGLVSAAAPGTAYILVQVPAGGSAGGGIDSAAISVVPGVFDGTLSATAVSPADGITITPGSVAWDGDEGVLIDGEPTVILEQSATSLIAGVPPLAAGTYELVVTDQGPNQISGSVDIDVSGTYTVNAFPGLDITTGAYPRNFFFVLDDTNLDDFFSFSPASDLDISVTLTWNGGADIDILWYACDNSGFVGNFSGATGANPELSAVTVPGGDCWSLWFNNYSGDTGPTLMGVNITSP